MDSFLEEPTLLDPHLGGWMATLMGRLAAALPSADQEERDAILHVLYQFSKVRGFRTISTNDRLAASAPDLFAVARRKDRTSRTPSAFATGCWRPARRP